MSQSGGVFDFGKFFPGLDFFTGKGASAWLMPTVNSIKRVPNHFFAPNNLGY